MKHLVLLGDGGRAGNRLGGQFLAIAGASVGTDYSLLSLMLPLLLLLLLLLLQRSPLSRWCTST